MFPPFWERFASCCLPAMISGTVSRFEYPYGSRLQREDCPAADGCLSGSQLFPFPGVADGQCRRPECEIAGFTVERGHVLLERLPRGRFGFSQAVLAGLLPGNRSGQSGAGIAGRLSGQGRPAVAGPLCRGVSGSCLPAFHGGQYLGAAFCR